jgi:SAM-dependent methyltransferase
MINEDIVFYDRMPVNASMSAPGSSADLVDPQKAMIPRFTLNGRPLRLLVAIASYGRKNESFLRRIIQNYKSMAMDVDVVVLSEGPKDLGSKARVLVGLPSKNPWSLPFGHKKILAENLERYDLFAYSEDDMEVTEHHIDAFLRATPALADDEIAGFLRYEIGDSGAWTLPEAHGDAHWKPESVTRRNNYVIGQFSNEHAGFYLLTQKQLRKAIDSGRFLVGPHEGRYGLPETAATDPYTNCGFRKVICVSVIEDFLIHHLPNRYVGQLGLPFPAFKEQSKTLMEILDGKHPASTLCRVESKILHGRWSKSYDEKACAEVLDAVPSEAKSVLSVGCGLGAFESQLVAQGVAVTVLPLDSVIGASVVRLGVEVVHGSWGNGMSQLAGKKFDCVVATYLLHLQSDPGSFLEQCAQFVVTGGVLVIAGPNFLRLPVLIKRILGRGDYRKLRNFDQSGISPCGPGALAKNIRRAGLKLDIVKWRHEPDGRTALAPYRKHFGRFTAEDWIVRAKR